VAAVAAAVVSLVLVEVVEFRKDAKEGDEITCCAPVA